jgi:hypothetical protein
MAVLFNNGVIDSKQRVFGDIYPPSFCSSRQSLLLADNHCFACYMYEERIYSSSQVTECTRKETCMALI